MNVFNEVTSFIDEDQKVPDGFSKHYHFLYLIGFDVYTNDQDSRELFLSSYISRFAVEFCAVMKSILQGTISTDANMEWEVPYFFSFVNSARFAHTLGDPGDKFSCFFGDVYFDAGNYFPDDFKPSDRLPLEVSGQSQYLEYVAGLILYLYPNYQPPFAD